MSPGRRPRPGCRGRRSSRPRCRRRPWSAGCAGELAAESPERRVGSRRQARVGQDLLERDPGLGCRGTQRRQHPLARELLDHADEAQRVLARERAELELEAAAVGHDVELRAALDPAHTGGVVRRVEALQERPLGGEALAHRSDPVDDPRGGDHGVGAKVRQGRVRLAAGDAAAVPGLALVAVDQAHQGRFADEAGFGPRQLGQERLDQAGHALAADLLVVGEGEDRGLAQRAPTRSGTSASTQARKPFMSAAPRP